MYRRATHLTAMLLAAAAVSSPSALPARAPATKPIGKHVIRTMPVSPDIPLRSATYTPSGKVLISYLADAGKDPRAIGLATMDDDGSHFRPFFSQRIPERDKDNGIRFMVFPDNRRIFLGDFVLECRKPLEACDNPVLLPVAYPAEVASGEHIAHRWSEMIVAPDNRHVAWTTLLANFAAVAFVGELHRKADRYEIVNVRIVSSLDPFKPDPHHPDGVLPQPVRGGEVKQFVHGGSGISVAGAVRRDVPDSVVLHLADGSVEAITDAPGYDETTIFSPDERLGITMTTRFSKADPAILGLVPRPFPDSLNMGLSMFAYTYAVTGVRVARQGNVGPALIDVAASKNQPGYLGINLNTDDDWVFRSPMSWHPAGRKAMWIEGLRGKGAVRAGDGAKRIRIVELPQYQPGPTVKPRPMPAALRAAPSDLSLVPAQLRKARDIDVKVYGRLSGHITYRRTANGIEKTYHDFSDSPQSAYSGTETLNLDPRGNSTYTAKLRLAGTHPGQMDLKLTFGPLGGSLPARIVFDRDASGTPLSHGFAEYDGKRLDIADLAP